MKEQKYNAYLKEIGKFIPKDRIYTDELRLLAWGTDAGSTNPENSHSGKRRK